MTGEPGTASALAWVDPYMHLARYRIRRALERLDNKQVRDARRLLRRLRTDPPDVVYLGESTVSFVAPYDVDKRPLDVMVADVLGPSVSLLGVHGGSYRAELLADYVRVVAATDARPLVVVPLWIRGLFLPWVAHPILGCNQALDVLRTADLSRPARRLRSGSRATTSDDWAAYHRVPHPTLIGDLVVGDYVRPLKDPVWGLHDPDRVSMLYAYHHGARLAPGDPQLDAAQRLGKELRELGCPLVVYQTPISVDTGVEHHGTQFADLVAHNFAVLEQSFQHGYGMDVDIIRSGDLFAPEEFLDPDDGSEHLNETGRTRLAGLIGSQITAQLNSRGDAP